MTRDEYEELAAAWGGAAEPDDTDELTRIARRTPRQARLVQWGELTAVGLIALAIVAAMVWRLGTSTLLTGSLILLLLAWSALKRHRLGKIALLVDESDRLTYVRTLLRAKEAELNRSAIGLAFVPPGFLLAMLLAFSLRHDPGEHDLFLFLWTVNSTPRGFVVLAFIALAVVHLSLSHVRLRRELARLRRLAAEYADEADRDRLLAP